LLLEEGDVHIGVWEHYDVWMPGARTRREKYGDPAQSAARIKQIPGSSFVKTDQFYVLVFSGG
jgi:hypothetical protein